MKATIIISGKVQHVGYRNFVRLAAKWHKVIGIVRNLADGYVEVFVEGEKTQVDKFLYEIQQQSKFTTAIVEKLDIYPEETAGYKGPWKEYGERSS